MYRTILAVTASMALTTAVVTNAWMQKKQFYPTVVHLTRSSQSMLILYIQAFVLIFLLAKLLGKIFFGTLRQAETENLMERTWYAIIDTCLAFTMFRDDLSPGFVAAFTIFFMLKGFHWLCEDRVDFMERKGLNSRSPAITFLFKLRITNLLALLAICDVLAIWYAYERTMSKGASVQLVFGFEYAILLTVAMTAFVKFVLHSIDLQSEDPWENKSMYMLYLDLVMSLMRLILYLIFIGTMFKIHTLPIFALRPMYLAIRKFRKSLSDIVLSRRAIAQLEIYPNATEEELANDNTCIICREEMVPGSSAKKLPCGHIFHAACLRSWFQRQQTCPTCRLDVLGAFNRNANRQNPQQNNLQQINALEQLRAQLGGQLPPNIQNLLPNVPPEVINEANRAPGAAQGIPQVAAGQAGQAAAVNIGLNGLNLPTNDDLVNRLQIPSIIAGLVNNPLPPPPPLPPVNLTALTTEELQLMESVERAGVEARIKHLQEIRTLMDAAAFKMDQYASLNITAPSAPPTSTPSPTTETTPEVEPEVPVVEVPVEQNNEQGEEGPRLGTRDNPFISIIDNPTPMPVRPEDLLEADEEIVIDPEVPVRMIDESDDEQVPEVVPETTEELPESVKEEPKPTNPFEALRNRDVSPEEQEQRDEIRRRRIAALTRQNSDDLDLD